jgi:hypothetical protein
MRNDHVLSYQESAWPSVFQKTLEMNINNTDGDDYSSSNDKVQANRDSLAKRIKEEIELRGMPGYFMIESKIIKNI